MATTTLELLVFYYPNATSRGDVKYAQELVSGARKVFLPYDIQLNIWPPDCEPYQNTVVPRVSSDGRLNDHPWMEKDDLKEIVDGITDRFACSLPKRLLVVVGRFGTPPANGTVAVAATYPDETGQPQTRLEAFVVVDAQYASSVSAGGLLAHEIGHAAGMLDLRQKPLTELACQIGLDPTVKHSPDPRSLMYGDARNQNPQPTLTDLEVMLIKNAFFAR